MVKLLPDDQLILLGRNKETLAQLYGNHPHAELIEIDVRYAKVLEERVAELYQRYGKIDVLLINNAGYEDFDKISDRDIQMDVWVNTFALMDLSRLVASYEGGSKVISLISLAWQDDSNC